MENDKLKKLHMISPFKLIHAKRLGISPRMLNYYLKKKEFIRVSQGVYRSFWKKPEDFESKIREILLSFPQGIIGLTSALQLHGIIEEKIKTIDLIVPTTNVPKKIMENVYFHRAHRDIYRMDTTIINDIPVTKLERTLIDLIRSGKPLSYVFAIARKIQHKQLKLSFAKLEKLSKIFRVKGKIKILLEVLPRYRLQNI